MGFVRRLTARQYLSGNNMEKGFIKLSRSFFNNKMWQAARKFSECEAWLDLIQSARFEASPTTSLIGSCEVTWNRGQYPASIRFLSKKWGQSESWVRKCLSNFKKEGMITIENTQGISVITLVNFDKYNSPPNTPLDTPSDTPNILNNNQLEQLITQVATQVVTQAMKSQHTSDTNNKKEEEYLERESNAHAWEKFVSDSKSQLLSDEEWLAYACRTSGLSTNFYDMIPSELDNFFSWIISIGEKDSLKNLNDIKRRFTYWWQGAGLRVFNQKQNKNGRNKDFTPASNSYHAAAGYGEE